MKLVVGLGNPGPKYETTRHNIGWLALDRLAEEWKAGPWQKKGKAEVAEATVAGEKVALMKPLTFMNLSGQAVGPFAQFFKLAPTDIIVLQDEVDLKPFALRLKTGGGSGGHNGLKSLDEHLGSNGYHRVRLGVGHPRDFNPRMETADWVLGQLTQEECDKFDEVFSRVVKACEMVMRGEALKAMSLYNKDPA